MTCDINECAVSKHELGGDMSEADMMKAAAPCIAKCPTLGTMFAIETMTKDDCGTAQTAVTCVEENMGGDCGPVAAMLAQDADTKEELKTLCDIDNMAATGASAAAETPSAPTAAPTLFLSMTSYLHQIGHRQDPEIKNVPENGGCSHGCQNLPGGFICTCPAGYVLDEDPNLEDPGKSCKDIDECTESPDVVKCDGEGSLCKNLPGSFTCACSEGYKLNADGVTCTFVPAAGVAASGGLVGKKAPPVMAPAPPPTAGAPSAAPGAAAPSGSGTTQLHSQYHQGPSVGQLPPLNNVHPPLFR